MKNNQPVWLHEYGNAARREPPRHREMGPTLLSYYKHGMYSPKNQSGNRPGKFCVQAKHFRCFDDAVHYSIVDGAPLHGNGVTRRHAD